MERRIERLDNYLKIKGITPNKMENLCGIANGLIGKARTEHKDISLNTCNKILDKFRDLNRVWLLTGEGQMTNTSANSINNEQGTINGNISQGNSTTAPTDADNLTQMTATAAAWKREAEIYKELYKDEKEKNRELLKLLAKNDML